MDEVLFRVLAEGVGRYLDSVDRLAATAESHVAGAELRRLSAAWRALLGMHGPPGARGRCPGCERRGAVCTVWRVAGAYFLRRVRA